MTAAATTDTIEALERQAQHLRAAADEAQRVASLLRAQLTALPAQPAAGTPAAGEGGLLDVEQAAAFIGMSASWVYKAAESGELPSSKVGRRRLFDRDALTTWRAARAQAPGKLAPRAQNGSGR